jgi:hypothetical protein
MPAACSSIERVREAAPAVLALRSSCSHVTSRRHRSEQLEVWRMQGL